MSIVNSNNFLHKTVDGVKQFFSPLVNAATVVRKDGTRLEQDGVINADKLGGVDASDYYNKENLIFDSAPVSGSTNPITSGGVFSALATAEFKRVSKDIFAHTLGEGVTAYNLELIRCGNVGLLYGYFKFESTISNAGTVATITLPDGFEAVYIQTAALGKGASNSTISAISTAISNGVITLTANGSVATDNYARYNWIVFYE